MSTFPSIIPNSINYSFGLLNISETATIGSGPIRFRHSTQINNYILQLQYVNLIQSQVDQIRSHYMQNQGSNGMFDVPLAIWGSANVVPSDSIYRYTSAPEEQHLGVYSNIQVNLQVLIGANLLYLLDGGSASRRIYTDFTSLVFNGVAPFILNAGAANPTSPAATLLLQGGGASQ